MYRTVSIGLITIIIAGYFLFAMKREVEVLTFGIKEVQKQISYEKNTINLLKAEFCHLTSPDRLRKLSDRHLSLASLTPERMIQDPLKAPLIATLEPQINDVFERRDPQGPVKLVKWHYKKMPNRYARNVKHVAMNRH